MLKKIVTLRDLSWENLSRTDHILRKCQECLSFFRIIKDLAFFETIYGHGPGNPVALSTLRLLLSI